MKTLLILIFILDIAFMVYEFVAAPIGYEDESGFHYGRKEE